MGIVKISEHMHERLRSTSTALSRSINAQAEHWLRVGMLAELNPALSYGDICKMLIDAEARGGDVGPAETAAHSIEQVA
ncbi:ParD-like family protein [Burkholderia cenocepacia]|uniref:ParD-like family protein n=1 Tax=Burkholderia cenocepacia TaxID=95486 RepID=UPI001CF3C4F1|nr:ParD-like family protein [Burkholderia cenocepacia]MCA7922890.1 ParD-like family protein [Burkholderia cenocepacia]